MTRQRPPRTEREVEATRIRARRKRRIALGWPPDLIDAPPRRYARAGAERSAAVRNHSEIAVPDLEPHPIVDLAIAALKPYERAELGSAFDAIGRDLVGEFVLAVVAGEDPAGAVKRARSRYQHDRKALIYGLTLVSGLER